MVDCGEAVSFLEGGFSSFWDRVFGRAVEIFGGEELLFGFREETFS